MTNSTNTANSEPSAVSGLDDALHLDEGHSLTSLAEFTSLTESGVDSLTIENLKTLEGIPSNQGIAETMYGHGGPHSVASSLYEHEISPRPQLSRQASNRQPRSGTSLMRRRIFFVIVAAVVILFFFGLRLFKADAVCISTLSLRTSAHLHSASTSSLPHGGDPI